MLLERRGPRRMDCLAVGTMLLGTELRLNPAHKSALALLRDQSMSISTRPISINLRDWLWTKVAIEATIAFSSPS